MRHIQLHDFMIGTPLPLPKWLRHPSRLMLKFSVDGVKRKELLSTCGDMEDGIWEVDGDVEIHYEDQLLTATILVSSKDSMKELGSVTMNYSQLLTHAEVRSKECYEFILDIPNSAILILVTCSMRALSPPRKQHIITEPAFSPEKFKSNGGRSGGNRALIPDASSTLSIADLEHYYSRANSLPSERKSQALNIIGNAYGDIYENTHEMAHLERAISIHSESLQGATFDSRLSKYSNDLAICLMKRFKLTGSRDDIEHAVSISHDAVYTAETSDKNKYQYIINHAIGLRLRFEDSGKLEDIQSSISFMNMAMELIHDGHPGKPEYLNNLAITFETRFSRLGDINDLETAIKHKQNAVNLTPDGHPSKPGYLNNLGITFEKRFERFGHVDDLEAGILHIQKAVNLMPDGHPDKPACLNNLGKAFQKRFDRLGHISDLETGILHMQNAANLIPDGHPSKPACLYNLASAFEARFDRLGYVNDLETAILHNQKAVNLTPDGHPDKSNRLNNLGNTFEKRFTRLGHVDDLETAILHMQHAVSLTPDGHPGKPTSLTNLGNVFERRFDRLGHVNDLEKATLHRQNAVNLTPDGHPNKPQRLSNLGGAFEKRFDQLGHINDLETAILHLQNAVNLIPDGHPDKPGCLNNLGIVFEKRFDQLGHIKDLEAAILHMQNALNLTPDGHPDKPPRLNNLAIAYETRFELLGDVNDVETAILHKQNAVDLTADADPAKPAFLLMLAKAFQFRFKLLRQPKDAHTALMHLSTAASLPTGSPRGRLEAAKYWAQYLEALEDLGVPMPSSLEVYNIAIDLLPRVAWLGIPITTQHSLLEDVGGIVRQAVSAAIKAGEYETAVEWAEAGRSIAWQNLLNLRTPVSELRSVHPILATRLETISRQLDISVRESNSTMDATNKTEATRSSVQLGLDWDNTVAEIRSRPGFDSFLKPKDFTQLGPIARDGPVIILNVNNNRCDALLIIPEDNGGVYVSSILLDAFSYEKSVELHKELKGTLSSKHLRARDSRLARRRPIDAGNGPSLGNVLRCLWLDVVKPIIDALAYQPRSEDLPHIWWCATGPLAFLPIHAAGLYDTDEPGTKLSDYVVSSYTPTLSTLLDDSPPIQEDLRLLAIAQANAMDAPPIPSTEVEVRQIQSLAKDVKVITLMKGDATVESVWREMETSNWVHLACHGQQNLKEPMKSGLLLHDGTLELQRLIEKPLPLADFAFLSACQTATGDEGVAEESLHLAAGMLFAGYKGVIATMWSIMDDIGPRVAEDVYRVMLKDGKPNRKAAAYALHEAVKKLRESKVDMLHWVPFIHIGR